MNKKTFSEKLLTIFGDIKVFSFPFFIVYDPASYQVKGDDVRELLEVLRPGDILLRAFSNYLDGKFIPGVFSHAAIYCGELTEADRPRSCTRIAEAGHRRVAQEKMFRTGKQMVIHSMAEGVLAEDILTFARCDKLAVLRLPDTVVRKGSVKPLDIDPRHFTAEELSVRERLLKGVAVQGSEVAALAVAEALRNVGRPYDFDFNFANFGRLSCSELVYFCYKSVDQFIGVQPRPLRVVFQSRQAILPDAFLSDDLQRVWASASVRSKHPELDFVPSYGAA